MKERITENLSATPPSKSEQLIFWDAVTYSMLVSLKNKLCCAFKTIIHPVPVYEFYDENWIDFLNICGQVFYFQTKHTLIKTFHTIEQTASYIWPE